MGIQAGVGAHPQMAANARALLTGAPLLVLVILVAAGTLWSSSAPQAAPLEVAGRATRAPPLAAPGASARGVTTSGTCVAVMQRLLVSIPGSSWPPPCPLPRHLAELFEGPNGSMPITMDWCIEERHEGGKLVTWTEDFLNGYRQRVVHDPKEGGSYGRREVQQVLRLLQAHKREVSGASAIVIGTDNPWVEVLLLEAGAKDVLSWEYSTIHSSHPQVRAKQCKLLARDFIDDACPWGKAAGSSSACAGGGFPRLDFAISFSSIEHSGLGRYGDGLNPDADLEAVDQVWCMLKPGALFLLSMPMSCQARGWIEFNAHRVYGLQRLAHITRDFEFVGFDPSGGCVAFGHAGDPNANLQPIAIFRKPENGLATGRSWLDDMLAAVKSGPTPLKI